MGLVSQTGFLGFLLNLLVCFFHLRRYHNDRMINYDSDRGVSVTNDHTSSSLTLTNASTKDSGNYTCSPYSIRPSSVLVHVLSEGKSAAAVQTDGENSPPSAAVQSNGALWSAAPSSGLVHVVLFVCVAIQRIS